MARKQTTAQVQKAIGMAGGLIEGRVPHPPYRPYHHIAPDIAFVVFGMPTPQGSKKIAGKRLIESAKGLDSWREAIRLQARKAVLKKEDWQGAITQPVIIQATFTMPHTEASKKRGDVFHASAPDLDKLQRALGDAISPQPVPPSVGKGFAQNARKRLREEARVQARKFSILADDALIVSWESAKVYEGETVDALAAPGVVVEVWRAGRLDEDGGGR